MKSSHKTFRLSFSFLRTASFLGSLLLSTFVTAEAQTVSTGIVLSNGTTASYENYQITTTGTQSGVRVSGGSTLYLDYDGVLNEPKGTATTINVASGSNVHGLYVTGSNSTLVAANTSINTSGAINSHAIYTDSTTGKIMLYNIGTLTASGRGIAAAGGQIWLNIDSTGNALKPISNTVITSGGHGLAASGSGGRVTVAYVEKISVNASDSAGLWANSGGVIRLNVDANGTAYSGTPTTVINSAGYGMQVDTLSSIFADNFFITSTNHGLYANAVGAPNGGISVSNATIKVTGANAYGASARGGKFITINNGSISTTGSAGHGLYAESLGSITASATSITSSGSGIYATLGGQVVLSSGEINAVGNGLYASSFSGTTSSTILVDGINITSTAGAGAVADKTGKIWINTDATGIATGKSSTITANTTGLSASVEGSQITAANLEIIAQTGTGVAASNGGSIYLTNGSISTEGTGGIHGVHASSGMVSITDGSITTAGSVGYGLFAQGATGVIVIANTDITSAGAGVYAGTGSKVWINTDTTGVTTGKSSTISANATGLYASGADSRITATNLGLAVTGGTGVLVNSSGAVYLTGGSIDVQGGGGVVHGVSADNGNVSIVDGTVTVTNSLGYGLYAKNAAGSIIIDGTDVSSAGTGAYADVGGKIWINVQESGEISKKSSTLVANSFAGLYAGASGQITVANLAITTNGTDAGVHGAYTKSGSLSIIDSTIQTTGTGGGYGLYAASSGSIVVDGTNIGSVAAGAYAESGGRIWINTNTEGVVTGKSSTITTTNGIGLSAVGTSSQITANNLTINAQGGANAVEASGRNFIYLTGGSITTQGRAVNALNGSLISLNGTQVDLNGANTRGIHANQSTVNATGVTVRASQAGIQAICAYSSGQLSLVDSNVLINGATSFGVYANSGTVDIQGSFIHIAESGTGSHAIGAVTGGVINVNGGVIVLTEAEKSYGIYASSGSGIATININELVSISTTYEGNPDNWDNSLWMNAAYGVFSDAGAQITISKGGTISTKGYFANALNVNGANGSFTANNVILITEGGYAAGAYVRAGSALTLNNVTIQTSGVGASGLVISGASSLSLGGTNSIQTSGVGAHGFAAVWGADFTLGDPSTLLPSITLNGTDSALVYVTGGEFSHTAEIKPSTLTLNGINLGMNNTLAAGNWGAKAESSGTLIFANGSDTASTGLWATGVEDYSYVNPTDGETIHTGPLYGTIIFRDSSKADGSLVRLDAYGILDIVDTNSGLNVGALNGAGTAKLGDKTLTIGGYTTAADSSDSVFSGDIYGDLGGIIKAGNGSFTLNGGHGTYTGGTTSIVDGTFSITNGGTISDNEGRIGRSGGSTIVSGYVDGPTSLWSNAANLYVGDNGNASLTIANGGTVVAQETVFNAASTGTSAMLIQGQAQGNRSALITGGLSKSSGSGQAYVTIDGGEIQATRNNGQFISGFDSASVAVGNGGAYINTQQYNVGVRADSFYGSGTLFKTGTGVLAMGGTGYTNAANGIAIHVQQGTLAAANMSADGSTLSIATLNTNGNIVFGDGTAYRVLIGENSTENSAINLGGSGTFQVGSNVGLILDVDANYSAREGDYFDIASGLSGTAIGAFTIPESGVSIGGMNFDIIYGDSYIRLQAVPEPSTYAVIAGVVALGIAAIRRKRQNIAIR